MGSFIVVWCVFLEGAWAQDDLMPRVADTKFSVDRGFYEELFYVRITTETEGAKIRYSINGSAPGNVFTSLAYPGGDGIWIESTTVLRALATKSGHEPSDIDTHTYIFPRQVVNQPDAPIGFSTAWQGSDYGMDQDPEDLSRIAGDPALTVDEAKAIIADALIAIPTLSLVMAQSDLFGSSKGIYQNTEGSGNAWERAVSVELLHPSGEAGFQIDAGIRMQGFTSRNPGRNPKHSLRLVFREEYGASKLHYPLFGHQATDKFDTVVLRSNSQDAWVYDSAGNRVGQFIRDEWNRRLHLALGQPAPHGTWVHLYLNGLYWGVYNPTERPDASFMASYFGGGKERYDIVKNHEEVVDGTGDAYQAALALIQRDANNFSRGYRDFAAIDSYQGIEGHVDADSLIHYLIPNMYSAAQDWPGNNYVGRDRSDSSEGFKFFSWDNEHGLKGSVNENRVLPHSRDADSPTKFHHALKSSEAYRVQFGDHLHRAFFNGGPLYVDPKNPAWDPEHPERNQPAARWMALTSEIETALIAESARWGDYRRTQPYTVQEDFKDLRESLLENWFPRRSSIVLDQFRDEGLYPKLEAPAFNQHGGVVDRGFRLTMTSKSVNPFFSGARILYTVDGTDPRLLGGEEATSVLAITATTTVKARVENDGEWSALNDATFLVDTQLASRENLLVSAVHYHPSAPTDAEQAAGFVASDFEYLEFTNIHPTDAVSLRGLRLYGGVRYDFDEASFLDMPANSKVYLVRNLDGFVRREPGLEALVIGSYQGKLSNGGETLSLVDAKDEVILTFTYKDGDKWPQAADGEGPPLQLKVVSAETDLNDPESWGAGDGSAFDAWLGERGSNETFGATPYTYLAAYYLGADLGEARLDVSASGFTFPRRRDLEGLKGVLEVSSDLKVWKVLEVPEEQKLPHASVAELENVTVSLPSGTSGQFVRLKIR